MTSAGTFPQRLTKIDDLARPDHFYLTPADECYFLGEYTARKGYAFSATNQLILNFKKSMDKRGTAQWRYKERAIDEAAAAFRVALNKEWLDSATLVPVPPSKSKNDPLYDDRLVRMVRGIRGQPALDVRELVLQRASRQRRTSSKTARRRTKSRPITRSTRRSATRLLGSSACSTTF
jgi:hypothetical protein